nr:hypothetical protein Itr_chr07CG06180 [Ipomoea trifida]
MPPSTTTNQAPSIVSPGFTRFVSTPSESLCPLNNAATRLFSKGAPNTRPFSSNVNVVHVSPRRNRCLEVEVSRSLALFLRLFPIGHTNSILHFAPVHHHTIFVDLPSLKKWKEKFLYVSYKDDITLLGFTNTWSSHITYTTEPYLGLDAHADLLCAGGLFDHRSYCHPVYLHQLSQRSVPLAIHLHAHSVSSAPESAFLVTLQRAQTRVKSSVAVAFEQDTRGTVMGGTIDPSGMGGTTLHSNSEFTGSPNSSTTP